MYCHKCGASIPEGMRYCHRCGEALPAALSPAPTPLRRRKRPIAAAAAFLSKIGRRFKGSKRKTVLLSCCAAVVLLGVLLLLLPGKKPNLKEKSESVLFLEAYDRYGNSLGTGSGFLFHDRTTVATNYHVIYNAHRIVAWTADGQRCTELDLVLAYDSAADLAILQCSEDLHLQPLKVSDSSSVVQGDTVYAIGYPLGLANTVSNGIISSRYYDSAGIDILQVTSAVSPGSSGGALLNEKGQVIGIICFTHSEGQNLNGAIASNVLRRLYQNRGTPTALSTLFG